MSQSIKTIGLTDFVLRQWKPDFGGTKMGNIDQSGFTKLINIYYRTVTMDDKHSHMMSDGTMAFLKDHPEWEFCKYLIFTNNFDDIKAGAVKLKLEHYPFIRTGYSKRTDSELPFLSRWLELPPGFKSEKANVLCLVLYSRDQLKKEHEANEKTKDLPFELTDDYGIVAILGLPSFEISPPPPITIMRNALGKEHGGNGEPLNIEEYNASVKYWEEYILCK